MKAVTAYNVIQALPKSEMQKLYKMLGIEVIEEKNKSTIKDKKVPLLTKASAEEYLRATVFNLKKKSKATKYSKHGNKTNNSKKIKCSLIT